MTLQYVVYLVTDKDNQQSIDLQLINKSLGTLIQQRQQCVLDYMPTNG